MSEKDGKVQKLQKKYKKWNESNNTNKTDKVYSNAPSDDEEEKKHDPKTKKKLCIIKAWYGHNDSRFRYQIGDKKGKDVASIVKSLVDTKTGELHLNPNRKKQYLNQTFKFGARWAHCKRVALQYYYTDDTHDIGSSTY